MSFARRIGVALTVAGWVVAPSTATSQRSSPGYTYRLTITGRTTEPNGRATEYVVLSGHALVTEKAGRLDVDQASRGAVAGKGSYILFDSTSMTIVSSRSRQVARLPLDTLDALERELSAASGPAARVDVTEVVNNVEQLGPGEPMLGMATTRYRTTQDYKVATQATSATRSGTERIVQELWIADAPKGFVDPFARLRHFTLGPGGYRQVIARAAERPYTKGRGIALEAVTTITSTSGRNEGTRIVTTMQISDLHAEQIDDDILAPPTDFQVVAVSALAASATSAQGSPSGAPAKVAKPAASDGAAAAEAKGGFVKILHGMGRRP
jgi:hypothetical protein